MRSAGVPGSTPVCYRLAMNQNDTAIIERLRELHRRIRERVAQRLAAGALAAFADPVGGEADVAADGPGDVSFAIDVPAEEEIDRFATEWGRERPLVVVAEGLGERRYGRDPRPGEEVLRLIADPIDGTRNLMFDMRSGWVLTALAVDRGDATTCGDVRYAVQSELPVRDRNSADCLWAVRGAGAHWERRDRVTGELRGARRLLAGDDPRLDRGYYVFFKFSPEDRSAIAGIEEDFLRELVGRHGVDRRTIYDDQYISNAGQMYLLLTHRYRFVADLRGLVGDLLGVNNFTSQPYDLCCALIAEEAGIPLTGPRGGALDFPLRIAHRCSFVGYANTAVRAVLEPILHAAMARFERRVRGDG